MKYTVVTEALIANVAANTYTTTSYSPLPVETEKSTTTSYSPLPVETEKSTTSSYSPLPVETEKSTTSSYSPLPVETEKSTTTSYTPLPVETEQSTYPIGTVTGTAGIFPGESVTTTYSDLPVETEQHHTTSTSWLIGTSTTPLVAYDTTTSGLPMYTGAANKNVLQSGAAILAAAAFML